MIVGNSDLITGDGELSSVICGLRAEIRPAVIARYKQVEYGCEI